MKDLKTHIGVDENKIPRPLSLVEFDFYSIPIKQHSLYPFIKGGIYVFLGEIPNMPEHCVVADRVGKIYSCYHTENFIELSKEDV